MRQSKFDPSMGFISFSVYNETFEGGKGKVSCAGSVPGKPGGFAGNVYRKLIRSL